MITRWFRGAAPPDKLEQLPQKPQPQNAIAGLFARDRAAMDRRKRNTITTPFGEFDLTERAPNPLDIRMK
jgi:hypothetical protein